MKYVSPRLIERELGAVRSGQTRLENVALTVLASTREIQANYILEDVTKRIQISIQMDVCHPLKKILVICEYCRWSCVCNDFKFHHKNIYLEIICYWINWYNLYYSFISQVIVNKYRCLIRNGVSGCIVWVYFSMRMAQYGKACPVGNVSEYNEYSIEFIALLYLISIFQFSYIFFFRKLENLDRRLEGGTEECCICFSVLHMTTLRLPNYPCRTCKKVFHKTCMVSSRFYYRSTVNVINRDNVIHSPYIVIIFFSDLFVD